MGGHIPAIQVELFHKGPETAPEVWNGRAAIPV